MNKVIKNLLTITLLAFLILSTNSCGRKGALYLEKDNKKEEAQSK